MNPPSYKINRPIYLLGDHHGFTGEIFEAIAKQSVRDAVILHVGDGEEGISFDPRQFQDLNATFAKRNLIFLGMRGNHSDPNLFDGGIDFLRTPQWLLNQRSIHNIDSIMLCGWLAIF